VSTLPAVLLFVGDVLISLLSVDRQRLENEGSEERIGAESADDQVNEGGGAENRELGGVRRGQKVSVLFV
jgi:hypothetical protein